MADSAQTLKDLLELDKKLAKNEAPARKAWADAQKSMKAAIDDESEDEIQFAQRDLDKAKDIVGKCLHACKVLHEYTDALQEDRDFLEAHRADVLKVVRHFGPIQKEFSTYNQEIRKLEEQSGKAERAAKQGAADTEADLGALNNQAGGLEHSVDTWNTQRPKLEKAARDDPASKAAEQARLKMIDLTADIDTWLREIKPPLAAFEKAHPQPDASIKRDLQKVRDAISRGEGASSDGSDLYKELLALKQKAAASAAAKKPAPAPIVVSEADVKKLIAPIVGLDPKDAKAIAELGKLLKDSPPDGWIGPLGKLAAKYKAKNTNGRAMAEQIVKLPVVKKQLPAN